MATRKTKTKTKTSGVKTSDAETSDAETSTARTSTARKRVTKAGVNAAPWDRKNPKTKGNHTQLSPEAKAAAKRRAKAAGRTYPNLIDNMWAASQSKK